MNHGSLFSGIGGFDLAAEWMGWNNVFHCEISEFPRKVLKHHFPKSISYADITKTDFTIHRGEIQILSGGFPCQPFSLAGKRKGQDDERYLWHEMLRAVQEIEPTYVIAENVFGITNIDGGLVFEQVCLDLENEGYEVQPFIIPAVSKDAPHRRDRVWFIAENPLFGRCLHRELEQKGAEVREQRDIGSGGSERICLQKGNATNTKSTGSKRECVKGQRQVQSDGRNSRTIPTNFENFPTQPPICGRDDGLPTELDGITFPKWRSESIKAYGNAIVPQVAYQIFKTIAEMESYLESFQITKPLASY